MIGMEAFFQKVVYGIWLSVPKQQDMLDLALALVFNSAVLRRETAHF